MKDRPWSKSLYVSIRGRRVVSSRTRSSRHHKTTVDHSFFRNDLHQATLLQKFFVKLLKISNTGRSQYP